MDYVFLEPVSLPDMGSGLTATHVEYLVYLVWMSLQICGSR